MGDNVTTIVLALIGLASLGMTSFVTLRLARRIEPKIDEINHAVNTIPEGERTLHEIAVDTDAGIAGLVESDQERPAATPAEERAARQARDAREDMM